MADSASSASSLARDLAGHLLSIGAVSLSPDEPFTWASGLRSPIYCDNRLTLAHPEVRQAIASGFEALVRDNHLEPEVVAGTATAGIPHAAWLADRLGLPMAYVRSRPKAHGQGNQIEGSIEAGHRVVVVEDLISTGKSSLAVVEAIRDAGAEVTGLLAIFSYGLPQSQDAFEVAGVPVHVLTTFDTLLDVARERDMLPPAAVQSLRDWRADPKAWSESHAASSNAASSRIDTSE